MSLKSHSLNNCLNYQLISSVTLSLNIKHAALTTISFRAIAHFHHYQMRVINESTFPDHPAKFSLL